MVGIQGELGPPVKVKGALSYGPYNSETLQLDGGVALLGWCQSLGSAEHNFEVLRTL